MRNTVRKRIMFRKNKDVNLPEYMVKQFKQLTPPYFTLFLKSIRLPDSLSKDDFLEVLNMPTRVENALKRGGIKTVGQFLDSSEKELRKIKNIGQMSISYFSELKNRIQAKQNVLFERKARIALRLKKEAVIPKEQLINALMDRCNSDREKEVIRLRYGFANGEKHTLEEIGQRYGITRERIRQIQAKAMGRMKHPITRARKPIIDLIEQLLFQNGGILTDEEADEKVPPIFEKTDYDGSSLMDMFSDLGWIQSYKIGDLVIYFPNVEKFKLPKISDKIISIVKKENLGISVNSIRRKIPEFSKTDNERLNPNDFILRYCTIDPRIEKSQLSGEEGLFRHYTAGHFATASWVAMISRIFDRMREPLHFTEIADMVNDLIKNTDHRLDVRRAHGILIEHSAFAHCGIRGTYGLSSWGLRKESTPELVKECLTKAGFPLHWRQIYNYVSKYKNSKQASITSILENNREFRKVGNGMYGLADW